MVLCGHDVHRFESVLSGDALPQCLDECLEQPPHVRYSLAHAAIQLMTVLLRSPRLLALMCTANGQSAHNAHSIT